MIGQAAHKDVETDHVREVSIESCYRKSSLHVWCAGMAGQAAHVDDAAPVDTDHVREVSIESCYRKPHARNSVLENVIKVVFTCLVRRHGRAGRT